MISRARRGRAGERDLVDARVLDEVRADRRPVARDDVDHAAREADLARELGEPQRGQRRRRVGLEHDRAAGGERGRELPGRHRQRVVPRHDLARDADRLLQRVEEERAADRVRATRDRRDPRRVEAEVLDGLADLRLHRGDRLADVARLELGEVLAVGDDRIRQRMEQARALGRRRLQPVARERALRRFDGAVDVLVRRDRRRARAARRSPARSARASRPARRTRRRSRGRTPGSRSPRADSSD